MTPPLDAEEGPSPPPDTSLASPAPPGAIVADDDSDGEPKGFLELELYNLRRRLRTVEAERDGWKTEAMALRARLGIKPEPEPHPWKRPTPGLRRVYLPDEASDWM